jgi:ornithine cyclodeaminase
LPFDEEASSEVSKLKREIADLKLENLTLKKEVNKNSKIPIVSDDDVARLVSMKEVIEVNKEAFKALVTGKASVPDRIVLPVPQYDGFTLFKPATFGNSLGVKCISIRPRNADKGLPTVPATILTIDESSGFVSSMIDGTWLTAMRTASGSAIATEIMAPKNAKVLTIFGAGMQADTHIDAILCVRPNISQINIVNRSLPRAQNLAEKW